MQIDKWRASVQLTVVDGTDPVSVTLDVAGSKVTADAVGVAIGDSVQRRLAQLGGSVQKERAELAALRDKVRILEEANEAAKMAEAAEIKRRVPVVADDEPESEKPRRGRPRKAE